MFGNWLKTSILMAAILALFGILGAFVGGGAGMLLALLLGGGKNVFAYWVSDEVVRWITGTPGYAASRVLFLIDRRLYWVDSDGGGVAALSGPGEEVLSPTWSPDGKRIAYTRFAGGKGSLVLQGVAGGVLLAG